MKAMIKLHKSNIYCTTVTATEVKTAIKCQIKYTKCDIKITESQISVQVQT